MRHVSNASQDTEVMKKGLRSGYLWSGFTARKILFGHTKKENAFVERLEGTLNLQFEFILEK